MPQTTRRADWALICSLIFVQLDEIPVAHSPAKREETEDAYIAGTQSVLLDVRADDLYVQDWSLASTMLIFIPD